MTQLPSTGRICRRTVISSGQISGGVMSRFIHVQPAGGPTAQRVSMSACFSGAMAFQPSLCAACLPPLNGQMPFLVRYIGFLNPMVTAIFLVLVSIVSSSWQYFSPENVFFARLILNLAVLQSTFQRGSTGGSLGASHDFNELKKNHPLGNEWKWSVYTWDALCLNSKSVLIDPTTTEHKAQNISVVGIVVVVKDGCLANPYLAQNITGQFIRPSMFTEEF